MRRPDNQAAYQLNIAADAARERIHQRLASRVKFSPRTEQETAAFRQAQRDKPRHVSRREYLLDVHQHQRAKTVFDLGA